MDLIDKIHNNILAKYHKTKTQKIKWDLKIQLIYNIISKMKHKLNNKLSIKVYRKK